MSELLFWKEDNAYLRDGITEALEALEDATGEDAEALIAEAKAKLKTLNDTSVGGIATETSRTSAMIVEAQVRAMAKALWLCRVVLVGIYFGIDDDEITKKEIKDSAGLAIETASALTARYAELEDDVLQMLQCIQENIAQVTIPGEGE